MALTGFYTTVCCANSFCYSLTKTGLNFNDHDGEHLEKKKNLKKKKRKKSFWKK